MTDLKQLTIAASLMVVAAAVALSPTAPPDQSYSSINYYGKRPQPIYRQENSVPSNNEPISVSEELMSHSLAASKVIIRPASMLTTTPASLFLGQKQQENSNDGCKCEPIDSCPIELMDFRFAVSCEYGTVRCCRPLEPVLIKETPPNKTVVVTPSSTLKFPKKSTSCRCKPRKECDRLFQSNDGQSIERKSTMSCPVGSVRCCDSGNMGNPKTDSNIEAHVLGGNDFRPVQLPYLKMPQPADERISEQEPQPSDQELLPIENPDPILPPANVSSEEPESTTEKGKEEQQDPQPLEEQQNPQVVQQVLNQPRPLMVPAQQQHNQAFGFPIRQPVNFQTQINSPIRNPNFNFPMQQNPNFAVGPQFQQSLQNQQPGPPFQQMQFRPSPPIRQPGSGPVQQFGPFQPLFPNTPMQQPNGEKPFNLQGPTSFPMFNQQQSLMPPPPPQRPMAPSTNPFQQQQFNRPTPPTSPAPTPTQSSGGFFSSLLNMFSN